MTQMSRLYDLNIVAQPDRSNPSQTDFLSEAVLFGSGRPVLMVPYITRAPIKADRALICWDGGVPATRAVHDAMPFLRKAKTIESSPSTRKKTPARSILGRTDSSPRPPRPARNALPALRPRAPISTTPFCPWRPTTIPT